LFVIRYFSHYDCDCDFGLPQTETARVRAWIAADEIVGRVGAERQGNEFLKASIHKSIISEIKKSFKKGILAVDSAKWFRYNRITVADRLLMELPMAMTLKVKKNEIVAIETRRSYTEMNGKTVGRLTYNLAQATRCDRKGIVERIRKQPKGPEYTLDYMQCVIVIGGPNQDLAALLWIEVADKTFDSAEELKNAILGVAQTA
jgi:hypothetical protein